MRMLFKIILALVVLAVAASSAAIVRNGVPLVEKPGPGKRLLTYLSRNTAETRVDHEWPELRTRAYPDSVDGLFNRAEKAVARLGWEVAERDAAARRLHAVVSTPWLRFKDDIIITVDQGTDRTSRLNVSSKSRFGRADYGANAGHIIALHEALGPAGGAGS